MNGTARLSWAHIWLLALMPFLGWWLTSLTDIDEGFYGAIAANMLRNGDYIVPTHQGLPWFEKPILVFWGAALGSKLFGFDFGLRLFSVLSSLGTMALCAWFLRRHISEFAAKTQVLILATSLLFVALGRLLMADPLLVLGLSGAILFWLDSRLLANRNWIWSAIFLGLGLLAKGPVAIFFFVIVVVWSSRADRNFHFPGRIPWSPFVLICAATSGLWYIPALIQSPREFIGTFVVEQNFYRLLGADTAHRAPGLVNLPYYAIVLVATFSPWWWHSIKGWPKSNTVLDAREICRRVFARWGFAIFVFFTITGSKLPHYILPCIVPLSLLAALHLTASRSASKVDRLHGFMAAGTFALFGLLNLVLQIHSRQTGVFESRTLANRVLEAKLPVVNYQIRARKRDLSLKSRPQETALPSLGVYFGRDPSDVETLDELAQQEGEFFVFTRTGRLDPVDLALLESLGARIAKDPLSGEFFELYRVSKTQ